MKDYVFRMINEEVELVSKIVKLTVFLMDDSKMAELPEYKKILMKEQLQAMHAYFEKLHERVEGEVEEEKREQEQKVQAINDSCWYDPRYPMGKFDK